MAFQVCKRCKINVPRTNTGQKFLLYFLVKQKANVSVVKSMRLNTCLSILNCSHNSADWKAVGRCVSGRPVETNLFTYNKLSTERKIFSAFTFSINFQLTEYHSRKSVVLNRNEHHRYVHVFVELRRVRTLCD